MRFQVITNIPAPDGFQGGNLATALGSVFHARTGEPLDAMTALNYGIPVFHLGEIIVVNDDGREIGGQGRKASKWFVDTEEFDTVDEAITRSNEINQP